MDKSLIGILEKWENKGKFYFWKWLLIYILFDGSIYLGCLKCE